MAVSWTLEVAVIATCLSVAANTQDQSTTCDAFTESALMTYCYCHLDRRLLDAYSVTTVTVTMTSLTYDGPVCVFENYPNGEIRSHLLHATCSLQVRSPHGQLYTLVIGLPRNSTLLQEANVTCIPGSSRNGLYRSAPVPYKAADDSVAVSVDHDDDDDDVDDVDIAITLFLVLVNLVLAALFGACFFSYCSQRQTKKRTPEEGSPSQAKLEPDPDTAFTAVETGSVASKTV